MRRDALDADPRAAARADSAVRTFLDALSSRQPQSLLSRFFGRTPVPSDLNTEYRHGCGEISVADALAQLDDDWIVLNAVEVEKVSNNSNYIDHIAIGPAGVFTISIRQDLPGAVWINGSVIVVDGERMPYIRDSEFEAVRAEQLLSDCVGMRVDVTPCLVLVSPRSLTVAKPPRRVAILTPRDIRPWLKDFPRVLSEEKLIVLREAVTAHGSWYDIRHPSAAVAAYIERFRKFQTKVNQSRHLRLTWLAGSIVLAWLILVVGIGGFTTGYLLH